MPDTARIRELNDAFRKGLGDGRLTVTHGISEREDAWEIVRRVRTYDTFRSDDDPSGEHDFGAFEIGDQKIFWKIDYYGRDWASGSPDPSDPAVTMRVLTIMLAEEY